MLMPFVRAANAAARKAVALTNAALTNPEEVHAVAAPPPTVDPVRCALVIGHSFRSKGAANATSGATEYDLNSALAPKVAEEVRVMAGDSIKIDIVQRRDFAETYSGLPDRINALKPDFIMSMHMNAFDTKVSGTEVLYYHGSRFGRRIAEIALRCFVEALGLPDRGVKPTRQNDRGGHILACTRAPAIICEPFFIDNDDDLAKHRRAEHILVGAYAQAIFDIATTVFRDRHRGMIMA